MAATILGREPRSILTINNYKSCSFCKQTLPIADFGINRHSSDGLRSLCRQCHNAKSRESYKKRAHYWVEYRLKNIDKIKDVQKRHREQNHVKRAARERKRRQENPDYYAAKARRHRELNPGLYRHYYHSRKVLQNSGIKFLITKLELKKLLNKPCLYCGNKADTIDHIIPISKGGRHSIGNLASACGPCNFSKSNKFLYEWKIWKGKIEKL